MELLVLFFKGLAFGVLTSLPIGGSATLIVREVYFKGRSAGMILVAIPLIIDWIFTLLTLFVFQPNRLLFMTALPYWLHGLVHFTSIHTDLILGCILAKIAHGLWKHRFDVEKKNTRSARIKIMATASVNMITIPSVIIIYFSRIFSGHVPDTFGKYLFFEAMILGGMIMWSITIGRVESARKHHQDFNPGTANARFAMVVGSFALIAFVKGIIVCLNPT